MRRFIERSRIPPLLSRQPAGSAGCRLHHAHTASNHDRGGIRSSNRRDVDDRDGISITLVNAWVVPGQKWRSAARHLIPAAGGGCRRPNNHHHEHTADYHIGADAMLPVASGAVCALCWRFEVRLAGTTVASTSAARPAEHIEQGFRFVYTDRELQLHPSAQRCDHDERRTRDRRHRIYDLPARRRAALFTSRCIGNARSEVSRSRFPRRQPPQRR